MRWTTWGASAITSPSHGRPSDRRWPTLEELCRALGCCPDRGSPDEVLRRRMLEAQLLRASRAAPPPDPRELDRTGGRVPTRLLPPLPVRHHGDAGSPGLHRRDQARTAQG